MRDNEPSIVTAHGNIAVGLIILSGVGLIVYAAIDQWRFRKFMSNQGRPSKRPTREQYTKAEAQIEQLERELHKMNENIKELNRERDESAKK